MNQETVLSSRIDPEETNWVVIPVLVLFVLLVCIFPSSVNNRLFFLINALPQYTGEAVWANLTILGDSLVVTTLLFPLIRYRPQIIWGMVCAAFIGGVVVQGLKSGLAMPRPPRVLSSELFTVIGPAWRSRAYPSGHAASIFVLIGVLCFYTQKIRLRIVLICAGALIAVSRICVGVHWPRDVIAGAVFGWLSAWIGAYWSYRIPWTHKKSGVLAAGPVLFVISIVVLLFYHTGYQQALWLQRTIAAVCLIAGTIEYVRIVRSKSVTSVEENKAYFHDK